MATVQTLLHRLALRLDPRTPAGVEFTTATIGTTAGDRFSAQRLLDIYNEARVALFQAIKTSTPKEELANAITGIYKEAFITFSPYPYVTGGRRQEYTLPADYIEFGSLRGRYLDGAYVSTTLAPIIKLDASFIPVVQQGNNTHYTQSGATRFVFEDQGKLVHFGQLCRSIPAHGTITTSGIAVTGDVDALFDSELHVGASITASSQTKAITAQAGNYANIAVAFAPELSNASFTIADYRLYYYSLGIFVLSDVTGGTTTETMNIRLHPALLEVAEAIALEMGQDEVLSLARTLTGGK